MGAVALVQRLGFWQKRRDCDSVATRTGSQGLNLFDLLVVQPSGVLKVSGLVLLQVG